MKAKLILKDRIVYDGGYIQEMVIWEVPQPVAGSQHLYKYRLFFGLPNQRIVGYDNERPKGDHRHYGEREEAYPFLTIQQLVGDFLADVEEQRRQYYAEQH
ncbi:toxin-antitoxin system TumE family protein [Thiothrix subterranea]|uniref:DUF6516 family protein n=1 Tax=Thiothrix subterranea TaxID=2735563 RepID=A0AA51MNM0_9GAMM|nr:DUF6516 family protein [Thiothrix subterranea]MDQ5770239.1 DUF6516 family protein [Thiothrix subterranea]WML86396.1 DUF6516 family protein [Thiothrix subterranea]